MDHIPTPPSFGRNFTFNEYQALSAQRAQHVRQLLIEALQGHVPAGYVLATGQRRMAGNALLVLRPVQASKGTRMVNFLHAINHRTRREAGAIMYRPTVEALRALGEVKRVAIWGTDPAFGIKGLLAAQCTDAGELAALVRTVAVQVCSFAPFTNFAWRPCPHDPKGKWE